ncbi:MAG: sigma-70 family RNA polymerase sigma factor [Clostridia bacterium]|nr:sigma-70 family RNA polymerase sigma factor [Clostridia bacterium]
MDHQDDTILSLLQTRSEQGLELLRAQYGRLGMQIADNILHSRQDAEECLSDALTAVWRQIPPESPKPLLPYFLRIVRNLALKRRRTLSAQKRGSAETVNAEDLDVLSELAVFDDGAETAEQIRDALNGFLGTLSGDDRILFVRRYWFEEAVPGLAAHLGITENHARVRLTRCKKKLKQYLEKEGITI